MYLNSLQIKPNQIFIGCIAYTLRKDSLKDEKLIRGQFPNNVLGDKVNFVRLQHNP